MADIEKGYPKENFDPKFNPNELKEENEKISVKSLSPEGVYSYETDTNPENFGDVSFDPITKPRNDLSPPSPFIPTRKDDAPATNSEKKYCAKHPNDPRCVRFNASYCEENPTSKRCNDENDDYKNLGLFQESVRYIFNPDNRIQKVKNRPVVTLYEKKQDDNQMKVGKVIRSECRCKDGSVVLGYLDTRTGQKDCSPCKKSVFNSPNIYKNYKTKKKTPNFKGKQVPLREQVGVSNFGDVNMKGCQTGNSRQTTEIVNSSATLNKIVNVDTLDSVGGTSVTEPQSLSGVPISLYDNLTTNVYGI